MCPPAAILLETTEFATILQKTTFFGIFEKSMFVACADFYTYKIVPYFVLIQYQLVLADFTQNIKLYTSQVPSAFILVSKYKK